jgi:hypothetical protein
MQPNPYTPNTLPTQLILRKAQPKRLGSFVLTGPVLAGLAEAYVAAINEGAVPTIATAWQVGGGGVCVWLCISVNVPVPVPITVCRSRAGCWHAVGLEYAETPILTPPPTKNCNPDRVSRSRSAGARPTPQRRREWTRL